MKTINGLPCYIAEITDLEEGILDISLVEDPAVKRDFVLFSQDKMNFSVQNEEKRIISGVVMLADTPIYRKSPSVGEYYIIFTRDTIELMVEKMSLEGRLNNITLNHDGQLVEGVTLVELFIKDSSKGLNPSYLPDVTEGSLIASYKVENEDIWNLVKAGEFKGFSLSGLFTASPTLDEQPSDLDSILELLDQVKAKYSLK